MPGSRKRRGSFSKEDRASCLTVLWRSCSLAQIEREYRVSRRDGHHLLALAQLTDRVCPDEPPGVQPPHFLAGLGVECEEVPLVAAAEYQPACGRKHARPGLGMQLVLPDSVTGRRVERANGAVAGIIRQIDQ